MDGSSRQDPDMGAVVSDGALEEIVDALGDLHLILDTDGTIQTVLKMETSRLGYRQEQLVGRSITSLLASTVPPVPEFDITAADDFPAVVRNSDGDSLTGPFEAADGTLVPIALTVVPRGEGFICIGQERPGYLSETQAELLDTVADPVFVLDAENRVQQVNDAIVAYTGYDRADIVGREMSEIIPVRTYEKITGELASLAEDSCESEMVETEIITDEGELIVMEAHLSALTDESGGYAGAIGVLRDIRERKRQQRNLKLLKQLLTRVFRHNIRNELMVIETHAELLDRQLDGELQTQSSAILESADRVLDHSEKARLIEQVIETDEQYRVDLSAIVEEAVESAEERCSDARIDVEVPTEWMVDTHPDVDKAIEELVQNAIEHAQETPRLQIWVDQADSSETLFIEDESGGLAPEEIEVLRSGKEDKLKHGSGVGLWLVRWLVEHSGAELIVHRTGEGTVVGIRFGRQDSSGDIEHSPLATVPEHVRENALERVHGDTVIGRSEAIDQLEEIYDGLERRGGHTVFVTGEAGIGKTTLVEQFQERLTKRDDSVAIATGFCNETIQPPYYAFRQILREIPGVGKILENVPSVEDADELAEDKKALFDDVADQLRSVAADQPVLLVIEDMQWADQGTVSLLEHLVEEVGQWSHPVLFLGTYRTSDVDETDPVLEIADETAEAGRGTVLELESLGESEVESLLAHMLGIETIPASFATEFYEHTGGIPLFVQELGRHLSETVGPIGGPGDLPENLAEITVPDTVERAITDRLEGLPEQVLPVLRLGAIVGQEFSFDILREASEQPVDTLIGCIDTLVDRQVWTRSGDRLEFAHGIVREQTLDSIDSDSREILHERVAAAIETVYPDTIDEYAGQLGHHYDQIGAHDTAFRCYRQAGDQASARYANEDAISHYERALSLANEHGVSDEETVAAVSTQLGKTFDLVGAYDRAYERYEHSLGIYQRTDDREGEAECLDALGNVVRKLGEFERSKEFLERSIEIKREIDDRPGEAKSLKNLGNIALNQSEYDRASEYYDQSLTIFREIGDRHGQAKCLSNFSIIAQYRGQYSEAKEYSEEALEFIQGIDDQKSELTIRNHLGNVAHRQGDNELSEEYYRRSLEIAQEIGNQRGTASALHSLAMSAERQGKYGEAEELLERSLTIKRKISYTHGEAQTLSNLAGVVIRQGKYEQGEKYIDKTLDIAENLDTDRVKAMTLCYLATSELKQNRDTQAHRLATEALELAERIGSSQSKIASLRLLGAVARKRGEYDKAMEHLTEGLSVDGVEEYRQQKTRIYLELSRLALARGDVESAQESVSEAEAVVTELGATHDEARTAHLRGEIAATIDTPGEAIEYWQRALETFEEIGAPQDALETLQRLIETAAEQGKDTERCVERATEIFQSAPDPVKEQHRDWLAEHSPAIDHR